METRPTSSTASEQGFSLLEFMLAIGILGLIAVLGVPSYQESVYKARVSQAMKDIRELEIAIERFNTQNGRLPDDMTELGRDDMRDPWDQPYQYLAIAPFVVKGKVKGSLMGQVRKDRHLNPLNSDYDLYSIGRDGDSKKPLPPKASHDDIVRAGNGGFVGLAKDY